MQNEQSKFVSMNEIVFLYEILVRGLKNHGRIYE